MLQDWAFAQRGQGLIVQTVRGDIIVLEFNEFLGRIASGQIVAEDTVISHVMTDGQRRRVGDLRLYFQVRRGDIHTENLPRRVPGGVLAIGQEARERLLTVETGEVRPASLGNADASVMLTNLVYLGVALLGLLGFSLLCAARPGAHWSGPPQPVPHYRPVTHPEHPPWLRS